MAGKSRTVSIAKQRNDLPPFFEPSLALTCAVLLTTSNDESLIQSASLDASTFTHCVCRQWNREEPESLWLENRAATASICRRGKSSPRRYWYHTNWAQIHTTYSRTLGGLSVGRKPVARSYTTTHRQSLIVQGSKPPTVEVRPATVNNDQPLNTNTCWRLHVRKRTENYQSVPDLYLPLAALIAGRLRLGCTHRSASQQSLCCRTAL